MNDNIKTESVLSREASFDEDVIFSAAVEILDKYKEAFEEMAK